MYKRAIVHDGVHLARHRLPLRRGEAESLLCQIAKYLEAEEKNGGRSEGKQRRVAEMQEERKRGSRREEGSKESEDEERGTLLEQLREGGKGRRSRSILFLTTTIRFA